MINYFKTMVLKPLSTPVDTCQGIQTNAATNVYLYKAYSPQGSRVQLVVFSGLPGTCSECNVTRGDLKTSKICTPCTLSKFSALFIFLENIAKQKLGHSTWQMPPNKCTVQMAYLFKKKFFLNGRTNGLTDGRTDGPILLCPKFYFGS